MIPRTNRELLHLVIVCLITLFCQTSFAASFISIADFHFDPFISCKETITPCPLITELQQHDISSWGKLFEKYQPQTPQYKQDTSYPLFKSTLIESKKLATETKIDFVLILGDFLGHHYQENFEKYAAVHTTESYHRFVNKTMAFLTNELKKTFPALDVYMVVGNNDSYLGDNVTDTTNPFYHDMADLWSGLINDKKSQAVMQQEFKTAGYYGVDIPGQNKLHLIVLNTTPFWPGAKGYNLEQTVNDELNWLHEELISVKANNQKAIIALHTPTGIDVFATVNSNPFTVIETWKSYYTERFKQELQAFADNIMVILPAHFHADWFQLLQFADGKKIPIISTPSITPIYSNNPAMKVFHYATSSLSLTNLDTYFYALTDTNREWREEYDFNGIYQPNCQNCQITSGIAQLAITGPQANNYKKFHSVEAENDPINKNGNWIYYWCQTRAITILAYQACIADS